MSDEEEMKPGDIDLKATHDFRGGGWFEPLEADGSRPSDPDDPDFLVHRSLYLGGSKYTAHGRVDLLRRRGPEGDRVWYEITIDGSETDLASTSAQAVVQRLRNAADEVEAANALALDQGVNPQVSTMLGELGYLTVPEALIAFMSVKKSVQKLFTGAKLSTEGVTELRSKIRETP